MSKIGKLYPTVIQRETENSEWERVGIVQPMSAAMEAAKSLGLPQGLYGVAMLPKEEKYDE